MKSTARKHILLVDDDRSVTQMLAMLLETRGYHLDVVRSSKELFARLNGHTDLILLDIVLPDEDGFDVCRRLKETAETSHIPIIMLSAKLFSKDIVEGLHLGADDYLTKPFEYEELIARMEAVMRRGSQSRLNVHHTQEEDLICELRKILEDELIIPFFQPIFLLNPFKLFGVEVLSRPQTQSVLSNPETLFKTAIQYGFYQELEILSWKKATEYASKFLKDEKLFLNCNPYIVEGPKFLTIKSIFENSGIKISNIVLEITERSAIGDYDIFYQHLQKFREYGFQFAVDDVGGGYASLESIVQTKPEIVKIDRHIASNISEDPFKKSIVKFIVSFCKENSVLCIAEGIETKRDLDTIKELGVDAVQGYYFYRPTSKLDLPAMSSAASLLL